MSLKFKIQEWRKHHPKLIVVVRVSLGFCLFIKGIQFIRDASLLSHLLSQTPVAHSTWLLSVIPWANLLGGALISLGFLTRVVAITQLPILLGAVFFVNAKHAVYASASELGFSIFILLLLVFILMEGAGPFSLDAFIHDSDYLYP